MSKIDQLIQQYCPEGVEYYPIHEIFEMRNGYTPSTANDDFWDNGTIPWFKMEDIRANGKILSDSFMHITPQAIKGNGLFKANSLIIATSATIGEHALVLVQHLSNQRFTNLYPQKKFEGSISMSFMNYYFDIVDDWCKSHTNQSSFASVDMVQLRNLEIPVPPLSVQEEIVRILDTFSKLQTELQTELQKRKEQYNYYRDNLLSFGGRTDVEWKKLGEVCTVLRGKRLTKSQLSSEGKYKVFHGGIDPIGFYDEFNREGNTSMVINVGASAGTLGFSKERFWSSDGCFCLSHTTSLLGRFVFYYLQTKEPYLMSRVRRAGIPTLDGKVLEDISFPILSLSEQQKIVDTLDRFDTLTNDLTAGLPAEIEKRKQQYEYYRDKLLTFKRKEA